MPEFEPQLSTDLVRVVMRRPDVDLTHVTWGEVFMQNNDGTFPITAQDANSMLQEAYWANRARGLTPEEARLAECAGFYTSVVIPKMIEDEYEDLTDD